MPKTPCPRRATPDSGSRVRPRASALAFFPLTKTQTSGQELRENDHLVLGTYTATGHPSGLLGWSPSLHPTFTVILSVGLTWKGEHAAAPSHRPLTSRVNRKPDCLPGSESSVGVQRWGSIGAGGGMHSRPRAPTEATPKPWQ